MKKLFLVPLTLLLVILLVACNKDNESDSGKKAENADQTAEETPLKVCVGQANEKVDLYQNFRYKSTFNT
ncbi:hypothetical protein B1B04_20490 [Lysinibacillus sp. KCTC 33748]|uniref:hypothetical protein n=1 Tax=unclassified Lysinibacillus TaxID=2636778 RepID=UPI0009A785D7|nr:MULTISPECIES: hypothetical protein [unclassified Lysinibacillus]OXS68507.1 hypothetical protein B1B04_20490 [Lysinibacillus sp. KCTC 33748]SKC10377.1 hypothetical protein SAMN06295926_12332 [Lysinibacillus sp. AC-3]